MSTILSASRYKRGELYCTGKKNLEKIATMRVGDEVAAFFFK